MAFPTAVNDQITDAITQSNAKVIGEAPAFAMGSIYRSSAQATAILFENAVAAQQQQNVLAQAAANQGVMQIYSADTAAAAAAAETLSQTGVADNLTSLLTALNALKPGCAKAAADATPADPAAPADAASADDAARVSVEALLSGAHASVDAMAHALDTMNLVTHRNMTYILQDAARSATLAAMIREPDKAKAYEAVLQVLHRME